MRPASVLCSTVLFSILTVLASAEEKTVPFLTPKQAIDKMTFPDGFRVNAFAAEPDVVQTFAFCFDDRGRVWVAENLNYVTRGSDSFDEGPKGRIIILEDTDGDGRFDDKKLFVDEIFFPSGLAIGFGGVWVGSPPNLLFIPDENRDDKPDGKPRVVLDGWGRNDRHETLNSFLWGPDGWLYGCHGVFTHSRVGKPGVPDEERVPLNAGVWRYHPAKEKFEVFAWGTSNPWGLDFDDHGQAFITACVIPHLFHMIQGGRYHRQGGRHFNPHVYNDIKTVADHRHKSAHGGARFYLADQFPERYRGRLFMCNIHQHDVITDVLERQGSGFVARHGDDFLQSNDVQWLGFNMEIGPDGAVYIIDWHDADICGRKVHHEETGRIWRVAYAANEKDTKPARGMDIARLSDAELVKLHLHSNDWYVRQARRNLHERSVSGKLDGQTHRSLWRLLEEREDVPKKLRALWSLHVTGGISPERSLALLGHANEYVRAWTIQFLCEDGSPSRVAREKFATMAKEDASPLVRLYLASACQRMPVGERWDILAALAAHEEDRDDHNLPLMIWYALEPAVAGDSKRALAIARSAKVPNLARYVTRRVTAEALNTKKQAKKIQPADSVSSEGLALWLRGDWGVRAEGGSVEGWTDRSDASRDASQSSSSSRPRLVESLGRKALRFDGEDDHLVIAHDSSLAFSDSDGYSVSVWVHVGERQSGWRSIVAKSRARSPWWGIWIDPQGRWTFGGRGENLTGVPTKPGWRHVCAVQQGDGARLVYVDGRLAGTGRALDALGKGDIWIGGAKSTGEYFRGDISEIRVYRRTLSQSEVAHLAANP